MISPIRRSMDSPESPDLLMSAYDFVKLAHAGVGAIALLSFWTAGLSRKGGKLHIASGRAYLILMALIAVSSLPLIVRRFAEDGFTVGLFFVHLLTLVSLACYVGWRAIRDKRDWRRFSGMTYRTLGWTILATGTATAVLGLMRGNGIFVAFGVLGVILWRNMLKFTRNGPEAPNWWKVQHYRAMIGNGIATHIAFLLIGLPRLLPNINGAALNYAGWLLPLAIGLGTQYVLDRRHTPRRPADQAAQKEHLQNYPQTSPSDNQPSPLPR
ncbi:MAG: hypothetical protein ABI411_09170 [Tahibacter sp.]